jgi:hypothetical protein
VLLAFLLVILFGLSMDDHVFTVARIKEGHDRGLPTGQAIHDAIVRSRVGLVAQPRRTAWLLRGRRAPYSSRGVTRSSETSSPERVSG